MSPTLECYACGRSGRMPDRRCRCGEPLWFVPGETRGWTPARIGRGIWENTDRLPATRPPGFPGAVGDTPLFTVTGLTDADVTLWIKDETAHPTGSFKDRGSAVGAACALDHDVPRLATVSHGNMARSVAATAAAVGLEGVVLVPADIPADRLSHIGAYEPTMIRVEGDYGALYGRSYGLESTVDGLFVNSDDPLRVAGQKTIAYEIADRTDPDAVVLPVSSGGNASAVWKGFRELLTAGHIDGLPRLYLVQAAACSPIADAEQAGAASVGRVSPAETVAYSIANADPPSGNRALAAVRATDGSAVAVSDDAILEAQARLRRRAGINVEPASATALAGAESLAADGVIDGGDTVVLVLTGTGLTEPVHDDHTAPIVDIGSLAEELPRLLGTRAR